MEELNKNTNQLQGLPAIWPKRPTEMRPSTMMPPATIPLAPSSFQVWKKPYPMTEADSSGPNNNNPFFMLPHDITKNSQNSVPPSDKNPITPVVLDDNNSAAKTVVVNGAQVRLRRNVDANMDPKKLKRIISNRVSAQKSRMKKLQYVTDMESKVKALEAEIAALAPQVALQETQQHFLQMEHKRLNIEISAATDNKASKDAEIEANKAEVNRLRKLHLSQEQQKVQGQTMMPSWEHGFELLGNPNLVQAGPGQMVYLNSNKAGWESSTQMVNPTWQQDESSLIQQQKENVDTNQEQECINEKLSFSLQKPIDKNPHVFFMRTC